MTAIRAERISKTYRVYESAADRLREILLRRPGTAISTLCATCPSRSPAAGRWA